MALIVLDASVLIALLDGNDRHHEVAKTALHRELELGSELVLPVTAYAELLVGPCHRGAKAARSVDDALGDLAVRIEPASPQIGKVAAKLRAEHGAKMRLPDAFVVATAAALGADRILTSDAQWPRLSVAVEVLGRGTPTMPK
jgi:predicted nucleic acid-binding protein